VKSDTIDARMVAELLAADLIPCVLAGDEGTRMLRRRIRAVGSSQAVHRDQEHGLGRAVRNLKRRPELSDLFRQGGPRLA
jgi:hypothetical protein